MSEGIIAFRLHNFANLLFATGEGIITYRDMRTFFAVAAMQASRDAAKRNSSKVAPQFLVEEVYKLVGGVGENAR